MKNQYSEKDVQVLSLDESIRKRPAMYLGQMNNKGFTDALKIIITDFYKLSMSNLISIELINTNTIRIKIGGTNGKINKETIHYQNFVQKIPAQEILLLELQVLKALSTNFTIRSKDFEQVYKDGKLIKDIEGVEFIDSPSLEIEFTLDEQFWEKDFKFNANYINQEIKEFAFLNKEIKFKLDYKVDNERNKSIYHFKNGLKDKLDIETLKGHGEVCFEVFINEKIEDFELEVAFAFYEYNVNEAILKSYVNKAHTHENGTHVEAVLKGIRDGMIKHIQKYNSNKNLKISKQKIQKNIVAFVNLDILFPHLEGSVKHKLINKEIIKPISNYISNLVFEKMEINKEIANDIIDKFKVR